MVFRSRIYYRNKFFHIGHLNTLLDNNLRAMQENGICYALIDDRRDRDCIESIKEDFKYLELTHTSVISVTKSMPRIYADTAELVQEGRIYLYHINDCITNYSVVLEQLKCPTYPFQLRLRVSDKYQANSDPIIGYTIYQNKQLEIVLTFSYIIKVLDRIYKITDVLSNGTDLAIGSRDRDKRDEDVATFFDARQPIKYHHLHNYTITHFRYIKDGWAISYNDPQLLTFKGLKARSVPLPVLQAFYVHASYMGRIQIQQISELLNTHLKNIAIPIQGVVCPLECTLTSWPKYKTEYICHKITDYKLCHYPVSNKIYIEKSLFGLHHKQLNKNQTVTLLDGVQLTCNNILIDQNDGNLTLNCSLNIIKPNTVTTDHDHIPYNWISAPAKQKPCSVRFYIYKFFYTGYNDITEPIVSDGYIDAAIFKDLNSYYVIPTLGYIHYSEQLTHSADRPVFMVIATD